MTPDREGARVEAIVRVRRSGGVLLLVAWVLPAAMLAFAERRTGASGEMVAAGVGFAAFMWWWFHFSFRREMAKLAYLFWLTIGVEAPPTEPHRPAAGAR